MCVQQIRPDRSKSCPRSAISSTSRLLLHSHIMEMHSGPAGDLCEFKMLTTRQNYSYLSGHCPWSKTKREDVGSRGGGGLGMRNLVLEKQTRLVPTCNPQDGGRPEPASLPVLSIAGATEAQVNRKRRRKACWIDFVPANHITYYIS